MSEHESKVAAFILFFVVITLFMMVCKQLDVISNSRRSLKHGKHIKVGGVLTNKIPKPEMPSIPAWGNMLMENRVTGQVLPVCSDKTGFWHHCAGKDPIKLSLRDWTIKTDGEY